MWHWLFGVKLGKGSEISGFCKHGLDDLSKVTIWWCQMSCTQVVQQIDQLTSSIDLGEDSGEASGSGSPSNQISASEKAKHVDTGIHNSGYTNKPAIVVPTVSRGARRLEASRKDHTQCESPPSVAPPAYPTALSSINNSGLKFNHGTAASQIKGPKSEANAPARSQKPPPYPLNSRTWRANKGKTPPCAGRRRLLSTTV